LGSFNLPVGHDVAFVVDGCADELDVALVEVGDDLSRDSSVCGGGGEVRGRGGLTLPQEKQRMGMIMVTGLWVARGEDLLFHCEEFAP